MSWEATAALVLEPATALMITEPQDALSTCAAQSATDHNRMEVTQRFTDRADFYHAHRPRYPKELLTILADRCEFWPQAIVADVGSGTGILSELFLNHGNSVSAVEPNGPMRAIAELHLSSNSRFHSVNGTAEATTLSDASVDYVTAAQAFHWFDRAKAELEFARILKPNGWIVLVWNERLVNTSPFARAYEDLLITSSIDYVGSSRVDLQACKLEYSIVSPK